MRGISLDSEHYRWHSLAYTPQWNLHGQSIHPCTQCSHSDYMSCSWRGILYMYPDQNISHPCTSSILTGCEEHNGDNHPMNTLYTYQQPEHSPTCRGNKHYRKINSYLSRFHRHRCWGRCPQYTHSRGNGCSCRNWSISSHHRWSTTPDEHTLRRV